jgi:hypothetical protein
MAGLGQRDGQPAGPDGKFQDRTLGAIRECQVEVEIARVVDEVEVVLARERRRGGGIGPVERGAVDRQPSQRTLRPAWRRTASALIASSAARLAAIAVVSAWS